MTRRRRYFYPDTDRHGNTRWYFKPPRARKKTRLRNAEGTRAFYEEQNRLMAMWEAGTLSVKQVARGPGPGTVEWFLRSYEGSATFAALAPLTQNHRRNFYRRFCRLHGEILIRDLTAEDIQTWSTVSAQERAPRETS